MSTLLTCFEQLQRLSERMQRVAARHGRRSHLHTNTATATRSWHQQQRFSGRPHSLLRHTAADSSRSLTTVVQAFAAHIHTLQPNAATSGVAYAIPCNVQSSAASSLSGHSKLSHRQLLSRSAHSSSSSSGSGSSSSSSSSGDPAATAQASTQRSQHQAWHQRAADIPYPQRPPAPHSDHQFTRHGHDHNHNASHGDHRQHVKHTIDSRIQQLKKFGINKLPFIQSDTNHNTNSVSNAPHVSDFHPHEMHHHYLQHFHPTTSTADGEVCQLGLTYIEIRSDGNATHGKRQIDDIGNEFGLHTRDTRFLDESMRNLPAVLVRRGCIIVNLEAMKAIIVKDRVLVFDAYQPHIQQLAERLQSTLDPEYLSPTPYLAKQQQQWSVSMGKTGRINKTSGSGTGDRMPFELLALEACLVACTEKLSSQYDAYDSQLEPVLRDCVQGLREGEGALLSELMQLKNQLTAFQVTLKEHVNAFNSVLKSDEDMNLMYLTRLARFEKMEKHRNNPAYDARKIDVEKNDHDIVEEMMETYQRKVDELKNEIEADVQNIKLTENHIQIRLDIVRNAVMKMELLMAIITMGAALGALGASLFGMNLDNGMEAKGDKPAMFWRVSALFIVIAVAAVGAGTHYSRSKRGIDLFSRDQARKLQLVKKVKNGTSNDFYQHSRYSQKYANHMRQHHFHHLQHSNMVNMAHSNSYGQSAHSQSHSNSQ